MTTDATRTEVDAAAALAARPEQFDVPVGFGETIVAPPGWTLHQLDHERYGDKPRRSTADVFVRHAAGFVTAVNQRKTIDPVIYADDEDMSLVAVLNDDHADVAGWRDNRVSLSLRRTPEWQHWTSRDGRMLEQKEFALHIEDGLREVVVPSAADMLDMAQRFEATTSAKFKGGQRLKSGERQFTYEEEIDATAGSGQVAIPDTFTLRVAPFYGSPAVDIEARFRFTLRSGQLALGYKLDRPHEVARAAFRAIVEDVQAELDTAIISGVAPAARA